MKKTFALLLLLGFYTPAFALFCPTNFNQINIGDTIAQVQAQCGKPDFQKTTKEEGKGPQEWNYYVAPSTHGYGAPNMPGGQQASLKMAIAINGGKVLNITVNGMSLASTTICGNSVSVGDSIESVQGACGKPVFVNKSSQDDSKPTEVTLYKYNSTPAVTLTFENGVLKDRK